MTTFQAIHVLRAGAFTAPALAGVVFGRPRSHLVPTCDKASGGPQGVYDPIMEAVTPAASVARENQEATEAWSGGLFDRFVEFREEIVGGMAQFGAEAMRLHP